MAAAVAANVPSLHEVHAEPVVAWYWPTAQSVHTVAPELAKRPLAQVLQDSALYVVVMEPCGHTLQLRPPEPKLPGRQASVGLAVGAAVGNAVGNAVGLAVGAAVGNAVGYVVGAAVTQTRSAQAVALAPSNIGAMQTTTLSHARSLVPVHAVTIYRPAPQSALDTLHTRSLVSVPATDSNSFGRIWAQLAAQVVAICVCVSHTVKSVHFAPLA
jgi:hypothetical protein